MDGINLFILQMNSHLEIAPSYHSNTTMILKLKAMLMMEETYKLQLMEEKRGKLYSLMEDIRLSQLAV